MINHLGEDAQSTGLARTAPAVGTLPDNYYNLADLAGLICQNPQVSARIVRYPMFVSLLERGDLKQLANDNEFTNAWATRGPPTGVNLECPRPARPSSTTTTSSRHRLGRG